MLLLSWVEQVQKTGTVIAWDCSYHTHGPPYSTSSQSSNSQISPVNVSNMQLSKFSPDAEKEASFAGSECLKVCHHDRRGAKDKVLRTSWCLWMWLWSRTHLGEQKTRGWFEERGKDSASIEMGCTLPPRLFGLTAGVKATEFFIEVYIQ